ncbi:MAG: hypothetical protein ACLQVI_17680 [Polyangiaceae bacterium]
MDDPLARRVAQRFLTHLATTTAATAGTWALDLLRILSRALCVRARSYRHVESTLKNGLDRVAVTDEQTSLPLTHENVRGRDYYH